MKILVTGGAGFIGSNFIRYLLGSDSDVSIVNFDKLTYAGNLENLADVESNPNYKFVRGDIADGQAVEAVLRAERPDAIVNFAAESHVDRSILSAAEFIRTNLVGTQTLLDAAREAGVPRYLQVSTDEVYGSIPKGAPPADESAMLEPSSAYSASKAGADLLALATWRTHGAPEILITRSSNNYGPYHFPEKVIPLWITNALEGGTLPIYGDGLNERDWIHVDDNVRGIELVLRRGEPGTVYNISVGQSIPNLELARAIMSELDVEASKLVHVADRLGHDRRYFIDGMRLRERFGWVPEIAFAEGIRRTIRWYRENENWWRRVKSGAYREYYEKQYGKRLREADS